MYEDLIMYSYSKEQFLEAIQTSRSKRQAMLKLGLAGKGGNYNVINRLIRIYDVDISHFTGQGWNKNNYTGHKKSIQHYLNNKTSINSCALKKRLLKEQILPYQCFNCKNTAWLDKPIPLELHHVDGDGSNNNLSNLQLLCPNCHALTENYRGHKKRKTKTQKLRQYNHNKKNLGNQSRTDTPEGTTF